ncbi:hypothetical protein [Amycolatopsis sp. NPDC059021]|uniref:hypothetical protein n=1 Tax=Amycolatopsis sp. NPDC059021 TaxID=3346704 RepID=UPI00366F49FB
MTFRERVCTVAFGVTITGTRSLGDTAKACLPELFHRYVRPFTGPGSHVYIGGAIGIDTNALNWLAIHTPASLTVVVPRTVADQPRDAAAAIHQWSKRGRLGDVVELRADELDTAAYHARNRWMVDHSQFVAGFPRAGIAPVSGTWYTLNYAAAQDKPRLVVPV